MFILMAESSLVDPTPNCVWKNKRKKRFLVPPILWPVFTLLAFSHTSNLITPFGSCAPNEIRGWWVTVLWSHKLPFVRLNVTKQIDVSLLLRNHCRGYYLSAGNKFFNPNWCNEELLFSETSTSKDTPCSWGTADCLFERIKALAESSRERV